jgi:hypothetical protein
MMLKCSYKYISIAKVGNSENENEDNILAPSIIELESESIIKFAISDGATESLFSKEWSDLLVSCYKDKPFDLNNLPLTINAISEAWKSRTSSIDLPWYTEQKMENGAFATFLGITLNLEEQTFNSVSIGDCTLFQVRSNKLIQSFPLTSYEDFGNTPSMFATNSKFQTDFSKSVKYLNGLVESGDLFILASDALAMWIFKSLHQGERPWLNLLNLLNYEDYQTDFKNWAFNKIKDKEMKNDDISVILINILNNGFTTG